MAQSTPVDYNGERTAQDIINWLLRKTDPGVKVADDVATISRFVASELVVVLGLISVRNDPIKLLVMRVNKHTHSLAA